MVARKAECCNYHTPLATCLPKLREHCEAPETLNRLEQHHRWEPLRDLLIGVTGGTRAREKVEGTYGFG